MKQKVKGVSLDEAMLWIEEQASLTANALSEHLQNA
jgi:hypothetical protein